MINFPTGCKFNIVRLKPEKLIIRSIDMKRLSKTLLCAAIALILGTGSAFAKGKNGVKGGHHRMPGSGKNHELHQNTKEKSILMGQITAIDEKTGLLKISDADGKEITITVTPFTKIRINNEKEEKSVSDIKKNDWIVYSLFNTETEKKIASRIFVKNK